MQSLFGFLKLANVGERDANLRCFVIGHYEQKAKPGMKNCIVTALQQQFEIMPLPFVLQRSPKQTMPAVAILGRDESSETTVNQCIALKSKKRGAGKVNFIDQAFMVEGEIAHRGKFIEVYIAFEGVFQSNLGATQLLILHLQFNLVDIKFVL